MGERVGSEPLLGDFVFLGGTAREMPSPRGTAHGIAIRKLNRPGRERGNGRRKAGEWLAVLAIRLGGRGGLSGSINPWEGERVADFEFRAAQFDSVVGNGRRKSIVEAQQGVSAAESRGNERRYCPEKMPKQLFISGILADKVSPSPEDIPLTNKISPEFKPQRPRKGRVSRSTLCLSLRPRPG